MPSKQQTAQWTREQQKREHDREEEAAKNERMIAKRERELDELEAKLKVDPPPELSPAERKERELAERLDALEGKTQPITPDMVKGNLETPHEHQLREDLRLRLIDRQNAAQSERNREHQRRCARQIKQLEDRIAEVQSKRDAERQRHSRTVAELDAALSEASDKLGALLRSLPPTETSEQRLAEVML